MDIENIKVTQEEKNNIKKNSPENLPLNPTGQGFSGAEVRRRLSQSIVGEKNSLLSLIIEKMGLSYELFEKIFDIDDPESIQSQLDAIINGSYFKPLVFYTQIDLMNWLNGDFIRDDNLTPSDLRLGQSIFIVEENTPDYWVSKVPVTQLSDLSILETRLPKIDRFWVSDEHPTDPIFNFWIDTTVHVQTPLIMVSPKHEYVSETEETNILRAIAPNHEYQEEKPYDENGNYIGGIKNESNDDIEEH